MAVDPDPRTHVNSTIDFYGLLDLPTTFSTPDELRRAYRQGSRKYHPDKAVRPDASEADKERAREQWDLFEVAVKLLEDASLRSQYDNARAAREQKKQRESKHDALRQAMVDRLERGENGAKRKAEEGNAETRELRELAAMGAKAREDLATKRRAMATAMDLDGGERDPDVRDGAGTTPVAAGSRSSQKGVLGEFPILQRDGSPLPAEERTVKVVYRAETNIDVARLERVFSRFGDIDAVMLGKVKNERISGSRERRPMGRGFVQFTRGNGVYEAIYKWKAERDSSNSRDWDDIEDVTWMSKNPPAWAERERERRSGSHTPKPATTPAARTPLRSSRNPRDFLKPPPGWIPGVTTTANWEVRDVNGQPRKIPSFPSFRPSVSTK